MVTNLLLDLYEIILTEAIDLKLPESTTDLNPDIVGYELELLGRVVTEVNRHQFVDMTLDLEEAPCQNEDRSLAQSPRDCLSILCSGRRLGNAA